MWQREADACAKIKDGLLKKGYTTPLVADMHFAPKIALQVPCVCVCVCVC